jgi:chromosome partitioning protein
MPIVVAFISQKGGVGKSTLARALAAVAGHAGLKVIVADLDPRQHTLLHWEKTRAENKVSPSLVVQAFDDAEAALEAAQGSDLLILDAPGHVNRSTTEIAKRAHVVVQPTGASLDDLRPTVLVFHELVKAGISKSRLVAALCRILEDEEEAAARAYLNEAGYEVLPGSIPERTAYRLAQNRGRALTETPEKALTKKADALMEALLVKIAAQVAPATDQKAARPGKSKEDAA